MALEAFYDKFSRLYHNQSIARVLRPATNTFHAPILPLERNRPTRRRLFRGPPLTSCARIPLTKSRRSGVAGHGGDVDGAHHHGGYTRRASAAVRGGRNSHQLNWRHRGSIWDKPGTLRQLHHAYKGPWLLPPPKTHWHSSTHPSLIPTTALCCHLQKSSPLANCLLSITASTTWRTLDSVSTSGSSGLRR